MVQVDRKRNKYKYLNRRKVLSKITSDTMVVPTMDTLPRVPDTHGDTVNEKIFSDLYIRTSWVDANVALDQIKKVS